MDITYAAQALALFWGLVTLGISLPTLLSKKFFDALLRVKEKRNSLFYPVLLASQAALARLQSYMIGNEI